MSDRSAQTLLLCLVCAVLLNACGKKGPPLAPLVHVPAAAGEFRAKRSGGHVLLQFKIPAANTDNTAPADLDHLEVYGHTGPLPAPMDYLKFGSLLQTVRIKVPPPPPRSDDKTAPVPDAATPGASAAEAEPGVLAQGVVTSVSEEISAALLTPGPLPFTRPALTAPVSESLETPGTVNLPPPVTRYYVVIGVSRRNRRGAFAGPVGVPISIEPPSAPTDLKATYTQESLALAWTPPPDAGRFNVYRAAAPSSTSTVPAPATAPATSTASTAPIAGAPAPATPDLAVPVNTTLLTAPALADRVEFGATKCFVVRSVVTIGATSIESDPTEPVCVTPRDTFPPAAPKSLVAVTAEDAVNLIWAASTDADLAGYVVLRGDAPDETMSALNATPLTEPAFTDTTIQKGHTYVYAVVAVDAATPPNTSEPSNRVTETMR